MEIVEANGKKRKVSIPKDTYNQLVKLANDNELLALFAGQREKLCKLKLKRLDIKFRIETLKKIESYLTKNSIPFAWKEPIYNMLTSKYSLDFPLDNSIALVANSSEITGCDNEILLVRNRYTGQLLGDPSIELKITAKVTIDHIVKFVKKYGFGIEKFQEALKLPDYKNPIWKRTNLALKIIDMRDKQKLTFAKIAEVLSENEKLTEGENNYLSSEENIKTLYFRFKQYLIT